MYFIDWLDNLCVLVHISSEKKTKETNEIWYIELGSMPIDLPFE